MLLDLINPLLALIGLYLALGFLFALAFSFKGAASIDADAVDGSLGFKLFILPGSALLWPWLAARWIGAEAAPPMPAAPDDEGLRAGARRTMAVRRRQDRVSLVTLGFLPVFVGLALLVRPAHEPADAPAMVDRFVPAPVEIDGTAIHASSIRVVSMHDPSQTVNIEARIFYAKDLPDGRILELETGEAAAAVLGPDALVYWQAEEGARLRDSAWLLGRIEARARNALILPPRALEQDGQVFIVNGLDGEVLGRGALPSLEDR